MKASSASETMVVWSLAGFSPYLRMLSHGCKAEKKTKTMFIQLEWY